MSAHMRGVMVTLIGGLAVAACASDGVSLGDAVPNSSAAAVSATTAAFGSEIVRSLQASRTQEVIWRHLPEPVSVQQFNQDKAKCTKMAHNAPGAGSPEMKFYLVFSNCMRSAGYEPSSRALYPYPSSPTPDANENRNGLNTYAHATT